MSWLQSTPENEQYIQQLREERPELYAYAQVLALALRIDSRLLRNLRLYFLPKSSVELEAELWFSSLIHTRNVQAATMYSGIARALYCAFMKDNALEKRFTSAKEKIGKLTQHWPETDRIEQEMRWAVLENDEPAIKNNVQRILKALTLAEGDIEKRELARWAKGTLPILRATTHANTEQQWLSQYVAASLGMAGVWWADDTELQPLPAVLVNALPKAKKQKIGLRLRHGELEVLKSEESLATMEISLPLPTIVMLEFQPMLEKNTIDEVNKIRKFTPFLIGGRISIPRNVQSFKLQMLDGTSIQITSKNATTSISNIRIDRLPTVQGEFFGREVELKLLNDALANGTTNIIQFIAPGGTGKTKMLRYWLDQVRPEKLIAWSFYSQGASEEKQPSATLFYNLLFDSLDPSKTIADFANQPEKMGEYLADLLRQQNCLLILDGFEPLQHSSLVLRGALKDRTLPTLLKSLAAHHTSLCIITTRIAIRELSGHSQPVVISYDLQNLAEQDGVKLLKSLHVTGSDAALLKAVNEYGRHALALHLLGNALTIYLDGDILKRDTLDELFGEEAYTEVERHAFKVMQAYKTWLKDTPELQLLYLLGLFDHPIEAEVLEVLWKAQIPGLTDKIPFKAWKVAIRDLREKHRLLSTHEGRPDLLDCHPLLREYFGKQLESSQPKAWQQAHKKLYEYYKAIPKLLPDTLEEMRPLFHAVTHGCAAGLHQRVVTEVYESRINRKKDAYNIKKLGAFSDELAAIACFFTEVWDKPSTKLKGILPFTMVGNAGFCLRALGRLREALAPMQACVEMALRQKDWIEAAKGASNLSELQLTLGDVAQAVESGARSSGYADQSGELFQRMARRTTHADALHQAGDTAAALALFREAEQLQQEDKPAFPRLYSLAGFRYCDLLLAQGSTAEVLERAEQTLEWAKQQGNLLLTIALDQLTLGRAHLQQRLLPSTSGRGAGGEGLHWLEQAVAGLRAAGTLHYLPHGLLARAALHRHTRDFARARQDLQEVFDIADGSGMRLHLTDYHLEMARLLVAEEEEKEGDRRLPLQGTDVGATGGRPLQYHIAAAARLITATGYHRRDAELAELHTVL